MAPWPLRSETLWKPWRSTRNTTGLPSAEIYTLWACLHHLNVMRHHANSDISCWQFDGRTGFLLTMDELRELSPDMNNKEIHVTAEIYDWWLETVATGWAITAVYPWHPKLLLLGDKSRTFKPGFPHTVQVGTCTDLVKTMLNSGTFLQFAVVHANGRPVTSHRNQVTIMYYERRFSSPAKISEEKLIPWDDGVIEYSFIPSTDAEIVKIRVSQLNITYCL